VIFDDEAIVDLEFDAEDTKAISIRASQPKVKGSPDGGAVEGYRKL
jgi:hypothetical protein